LPLLFLLLALIFSYGRIGTSCKSFPFLYSDAANIASFAAALDQPTLFGNDTLLANHMNFAWYNTIHIPLIRFLGKVLGDYGAAFAVLIFPACLLHLFGFYLLGLSLFKDKLWAFSLAIITFIPVRLNLGEFWGAYGDINPRVLFQSLLPFILAAVIKWGSNPKYWPYLMSLIGLLVYIHPVSTPAWGLAIIGSLWFQSPEIKPNKKIRMLILSALVFLVVIAPFTWSYISRTAFGDISNLDHDLLITIMKHRFIPGFLDLRRGFIDFLRIVVLSDWINFSLWAWTFFAGILYGITKFRKKEQWHGFTLAAWWVGILFTSVLIPIVDHKVTASMNRVPFEVDLIRGLRYTIPLVLTTSFLLVRDIARSINHKFKNEIIPIISVLSAIGFVLLWIGQNDFFNHLYINRIISCVRQGSIICPLSTKDQQRIDFLDAVKEKTSPGSRIMSNNFDDLSIRYHSLRPLIYSYKDGGAFLYANHIQLLEWYEQFNEMNALEKLQNDRQGYLDAYLELGIKYGAEYLVLQAPYFEDGYYPDGLSLVYTNDFNSLYQIEKR
jgi:hypothetical protein